EGNLLRHLETVHLRKARLRTQTDVERRTEPEVDAGRRWHADGRTASALLDAHRRRGRVGRQGDEAHASAGRGSRPLPGPGWHLWSPRPALRASPRRSILWMGRGLWAALPLPRLGVGSHRQVLAAALRGGRESRGALQGPRAYQGVSRGGQSRPAMGLPGTAAGAARAHLGAFHLAKRLRADRLLGSTL